MIEYRVKPVSRYIVTRYESIDHGDGTESGGVEQRGEYENAETAYQVAYALCRMEHERSGEPFGSMEFIYPSHPEAAGVKVA